MKKLLFLTCFALLCSFMSLSQSPIWVVGNQQLQGTQTTIPLPTGPTNLDYQGQQANASANAYHNPVSGDLLFFIVDGVVYDNEGYRINKLQLSSSAIDPIIGQSEIVIVPDPGNCKRYYIFADSYHKPILPFYDGVLYYGILDLSIPRTQFNTNRTGDLISFGPNQNVVSLFSLIPSNLMFISGIESGASQIAVSPKDANGEHLLLYQKDVDVLYGFKITGNGISFVSNSIFDVSQGVVPAGSYVSNTHANKRSELEIYPKPSGGYMVVGRTKTLQVGSERIFKVDYAQNGSPITPSYAFCSISQAAPNELVSVPKGLEISPNGQFAYVTRTVNSVTQKAIVCIDLNTMNQVALPGITINDAQPFQYSMIESNGTQLFLAKADGLFRINNADNPVIANLANVLTFAANNQLNLSYIQQNIDAIPVQIPTLPDWEYNFGLYLLPDQLDFDPNCQIACYDNCNFNSSDAACCEFYSGSVFVPESNVIEINTATVWEPGALGMPFDVVGGLGVVRKNIVVKPGASLTINNLTLEFFNEKQIIVERDANTSVVGGRLYVNNSNLTVNANCGNCTVWGGIVLQGHTSVSPSSASHAYAHINNSNIEHASTAISSSAGQLLVNESTFKNNSRSVNLSPYSHPYQCHIYKSHFFTDGILNNPVDYPIVAHIRMQGARRVVIQGCIFENQTPEMYAPGTRGIGILAIASSFHVSSCNPGSFCPYGFQQSAFNNLALGIGTIGYFSGFANNVYACHFNNNVTGIAQINGFNSQTIFCQFTVPSMVWDGQDVLTTGIHLLGSTDYTISDNTFLDDDNNNMTGLNYGMVVDNSGPYSNQIDRNSFLFLHTATISQNTNAQDYFSLDYKGRGLQWLCNEFRGSRFVDIGVPTGLIANWQGACDAWNGTYQNSTANNRFLSPQPSHIRMGALVPPINYYHLNEPALTPTNITGNVFPIICTPPNPYDINSICDYSLEVRSMLTNDLIAARNSNLFEQSELLDILDYGDKDSLIQEVLLPFMSDQEKRDMLNNETIVISDEVLINYILSNPPNTMLYQVLAFNSPLNEKVMYYVMEESTLPSGMKSQIVLLQNGVSEYDARLYSLRKLTVSCNFIENELISRYLNDSTGIYSMDNVVALFENSAENDRRIQEKLFGAYIAQGNTSKADSIKNILNLAFDDFDYHFLNEIAVQLIENDIHTLIEADSSFVDRLESIAALELPLLSPRAVALLNIIEPKFEVIVHDYSVDPKNQQLIRPQYTYDGSIYEPITVFPNPASDHFFIVFDEYADVSQNREARIYDLAGNLQFTRSFDDNAYVLEINTDNMTQGMYIVVISANGVDIGTYKVAVR